MINTKRDIKLALNLIEIARDAVAEAARNVDTKSEIHARMFNLSMDMTHLIGDIKRLREGRATDALIALSLNS